MPTGFPTGTEQRHSHRRAVHCGKEAQLIMDANKAPFAPHEGDWEGVVMVIRPDISKLSRGDLDNVPCKVLSARTVQFNGMRAINTVMPYYMVRHFFQAGDNDHVFVEAEFKDGVNPDGSGHIEFYKRSRATLGDWVRYSMTADQQARVQ
jgi:hypothetical protein